MQAMGIFFGNLKNQESLVILFLEKFVEGLLWLKKKFYSEIVTKILNKNSVTREGLNSGIGVSKGEMHG